MKIGQTKYCFCRLVYFYLINMKLLVLLAFFFHFNILMGQNLVPNGDFENYSICPDHQGQIDRAFPWLRIGCTPDYLNSCDTTNHAGVPFNDLGFRYAHYYSK